jgi:hypothetical protein
MRPAIRVVPALLMMMLTLQSIGTFPPKAAFADAGSYVVTPAVLANATPTDEALNPLTVPPNGQAHAAQGITGVDSLPNFNGHFHLAGFNQYGNPQSDWYTNTVGHMPGDGGTTTIGAPVIPVAVELLFPDGSVGTTATGAPLYYDPTPIVNPTLNSPIFQNASYSSSSTPTQLIDAIQRAEYFQPAKEAPTSWHTMLAPQVAAPMVVQIPAGHWYYAANADGTCCRFVLLDNATFGSAFFNQVVVPAIVNGTINQYDISTFLFPNTFLYIGDLAHCCVLGYHTYAHENVSTASGNVDIRWVFNYSSWVSAGLFKHAQDVSTLSHELAESFNDPFVTSDGLHNITPWWLSSGNCQDNLEVGDVTEGLANALYPITLNGVTYHVQNFALLQWFEGTKSNAVGGAYSYPDTTVLTSPAVSQKYRCGS